MSEFDTFLSTTTQAKEDEKKLKPCPYCGEKIPKMAKKCRFCNEILDPVERKKQEALAKKAARPTQIWNWNSSSGCGCISEVIGSIITFIIIAICVAGC